MALAAVLLILVTAVSLASPLARHALVRMMCSRPLCYTETVKRTDAAGVEVQNVTLTLPAHLLRQARHLAVDQGVSLSRFLATALEQEVESTRGYRAAHAAHRRLLEQQWDLGTGGRATWTRDSLHER